MKVNKGKFTFDVAPLLGFLLLAIVTFNTVITCNDFERVACARLPLLSILSDKNRREY